MLLPSDTHTKPVMFITAVLLPFVTYLLILPRTILRRLFYNSVLEFKLFKIKEITRKIGLNKSVIT
jgi:hypothetical protein